MGGLRNDGGLNAVIRETMEAQFAERRRLDQLFTPSLAKVE